MLDFAVITVTEIKCLNSESILATVHAGRDNDADGWHHMDLCRTTMSTYPLFTCIATLIIWVLYEHVYKTTVEQRKGYTAYGINRHQQLGTRLSCSGASL